MSTTPQSQFWLAQDLGFCRRLGALLAAEAEVVLTEDTGTAHHTERIYLARLILGDPVNQAIRLALNITNAGNLVSEDTTFDSTVGGLTTSATDGEIRSQIVSLWNAMAGV